VNGKFCSAKWALAQKQGQRAGLEISIKPDACRAGALARAGPDDDLS
jgi:hypothetical protein